MVDEDHFGTHAVAAGLPFGHDYEVTGRSLLLLMLQPTSDGRQVGAERSFRHVLEAVGSASAAQA